VDVGDGADGIEILLHRLLERRFALREDADQAGRRIGLLDETDRCLTRDREGHERIGEEYRVAERQDRQLGRNLERPLGFLQGLACGPLLIRVAHIG
jgi:hypothetical protein